MRIKLNQKVKGSTLVEVVTALVIISLCLGLTGALFANVLDSSNRIVKQQAWCAVNEYCNRIKCSGDLDLEVPATTRFLIVKETTEQDEKKGLWLVSVSAERENGKVICRRRFWIEHKAN